MKEYLIHNEWSIIEKGFDPLNHQASESIFSLGNGKMGQRANFEENYSGSTLQGNYIAGVYYPDKTRVGWWKNGYPEYFAKVLNAPNWVGIGVKIDGIELDLHYCKTENFIRTLNMQEGYLLREFDAFIDDTRKIRVSAKRFLSMDTTEIGAIRYSIKLLNFSAEVSLKPYIDGDIKNEDSNYDEKFWNILLCESEEGWSYLETQTKKTDFRCGFAMKYKVFQNNKPIKGNIELIQKNKFVGNRITQTIAKNDTITLEKYVAVSTSLNHPEDQLKESANSILNKAYSCGFEKLFALHKQIWADKWVKSDIVIKGDIAAQQAIRFNIFQLNQTYTGEDERLNVGPKGFTGEKYGGTTYWDTEAYCIPFFLMTSPSEVTRQLLIYRYKHLPKAIENAQKLGFKDGAALFPMVTANGEECHNEWEITFEEIHRNGAIAFAIHNYIRHTGDKTYLAEYGLELLIGISRFWSQRCTYSEEREKYVMLGVTGPNEYENNVNNNWYTNKLAVWSMKYTLEAALWLQSENPARFNQIANRLNFSLGKETSRWEDIIKNIHFPYSNKYQVHLQQDGFLDKEQVYASELNPSERPINQHWSWDRILRSNFIKQADTLQGIYLFEEEFSNEEIECNFDFYEPRTVHESSLSPCVHSILASKIGKIDKAYEMYLRTSRLDLDDYNSEVHEGLHITSMAGTWMSIVEGFGGKRAYNEKLYLNPIIPKQWQEYAFRITFKGNDMEVVVSKSNIEIRSLAKENIDIVVYGEPYTIQAGEKLEIKKDKVEQI